MEHGGRISCCKTLVVAPWQGRRQGRGRGAAAPPPFKRPDQLTQIQQDGGRFSQQITTRPPCIATPSYGPAWWRRA